MIFKISLEISPIPDSYSSPGIILYANSTAGDVKNKKEMKRLSCKIIERLIDEYFKAAYGRKII